MDANCSCFGLDSRIRSALSKTKTEMAGKRSGHVGLCIQHSVICRLDVFCGYCKVFMRCPEGNMTEFMAMVPG